MSTMFKATIGLIIGSLMMAAAIRLIPRPSTVEIMGEMKCRILRFAAANGSLPTTADQLPDIDGFYNSERDEWGQPITWTAEKGRVRLLSLGPNGERGTGWFHDDIIAAFWATKLRGGWEPEDVSWLYEPLPHYERQNLKDIETEINDRWLAAVKRNLPPRLYTDKEAEQIVLKSVEFEKKFPRERHEYRTVARSIIFEELGIEWTRLDYPEINHNFHCVSEMWKLSDRYVVYLEGSFFYPGKFNLACVAQAAR